VVVHVDSDALARDRGERCEVDGVAIAPETARRLACDAAVVPILEAEGSTLSVGRKRRTIPPGLRRALEARDGGCRFPGCESRHYIDAHHVTHWARGGETRLDNLVLLCRRHHRLVHEGGFSVAPGPHGEVRFRTPCGLEVEPVPSLPRANPSRLTRGNARAGRAINAGTCLSGTGGRVDFGLAVDQMASIAGSG
jgi:hypothetical protein